MAQSKYIPENDFRRSVLAHKGYFKAIAKDFGVSVFKIQEMIDLYYKPSEIAAIRGTQLTKRGTK